VELALDQAVDPSELTVPVSGPDLDAPDLAGLAERIAPVSLARERTLPLPPLLADLFPEGGLVRGRWVSCAGSSATSLALALVAPAIAAGGWLALIDLPTIGLDAASEYGVPLERVVRIDTAVPTADRAAPPVGDDHRRRWPEVVAAAADGFDVLMVRVPPHLSPAIVRKVSTRVQRRGAVVVVLGDPGSMTCDVELDTGSATWTGVVEGAGHFVERRVTVGSSGRRMPGRCRRQLLLPGT
jgi:hypothetical protein